ncbi:GNAT family N-acetyltransferase [Sphaerisporangium sp. TRM90804]|uniref:GNAT family N-acetyltransferase n=1 Tax=Sphaerisporangium sp. TRM90804 TaxID=3031113 RepID=UPI00244A61D5|nr:GNAT family N-acetyltransferase [Sphaerisporangium sp. TRM90804]MDH2427385.1 GNAT family N-acetyltransferase [Sphaerisporangium sp. TRM90804]
MEIRDLAVDDLDAVLDGRKRAFGPIPAGDAGLWREIVTPMLGAGRYLGVFDGTRLIGTSRINDYDQWWHGRPLSMGGVAGVTVAPEDRGRGVGRALMRATIERCADLGHVASALYPATTPLYRGLGWEHAGSRHRVTLPTEALRTLGDGGGGVKLRRIGPDDAPELRNVLERVYGASRASGPLGWEERVTRLWLSDEDDFAYLADDGFAVYRWHKGDINVDNLVAGSEATARALWSLVGTASTVASTVTASVEPDDPVLWLLRERSHDAVQQVRWMFRLVDLPAAVAARGYPAGVTLDTVVSVDDPERPANSGAWRLEVSGGKGTLSAAGGRAPEAPRFSIGGVSALFAGVQPATLRRTGLVTGGAPAVDELLGSAFAAKPYMIDYF